jgi:radical SAM protein with 4Fe4S-binding SPASM domain
MEKCNLILNPNYILRHEDTKTYILQKPEFGKKSIICVIHPVYAMMLSFFSGETYGNIIKNISSHFNISENKIKNHFDSIIENEKMFENNGSVFPEKTIIKVNVEDINSLKHNYIPSNFLYDNVSLSINRFQAPLNIICNLTMKCVTSCVYCYADRKNHQKDSVNVDRLIEIIDEAKKNGVLTFKLMGGEVLLYKDWYKIFKKMKECDYYPYLSTKIPLNEKHVGAIKELELNNFPIQISLDTLIKDHLYKILNVKDPYYDSIKQTFKLFEKHNIKYTIHTIITNKNSSLDDIKSLEKFLADKKQLVEWVLDSAKCSMFLNKSYSNYSPSIESVKKIQDYIKEINDSIKYSFKILPPNIVQNVNNISNEKKATVFESRTPCSGNLNALYILPDGKVTICEELYWHDKFLIGDIKKQSLMEIWNSQKAKDLFYLNQNDFRKESPCSRCNDFEKCRKFRHVCWRDTILAYGANNWDFPDLFCPYAPKVEKDIAMK